MMTIFLSTDFSKDDIFPATTIHCSNDVLFVRHHNSSKQRTLPVPITGYNSFHVGTPNSTHSILQGRGDYPPVGKTTILE